jgi:macrolide transport system ATP-binding/permease protein
VDSVTPEINASGSLRIANIKANASINGVNEQYFRVRNIKMVAGAGFNRDAVQRHAQIVVIDYHTRERLFKKWEQPIGKTILVNTLPCIVVGVMAKNDTFGGPSSSLQVLIPYTTAITGLTGRPWFDTITVRVRDGIPSAVAEHSLTKLLTARHGRKDFFTFSFDKVIQSIKKSTDTMTLFVLSIAMISLLVGGVGVMNIMLVSVTERTQEIGIRMAVGARQSDILQQFLIEAVLVCLAGGVLGILLSFALGGIFSLLVKIITLDFSIPSIILACACSMLIGVVFGFWPARNAARLDPINALARE